MKAKQKKIRVFDIYVDSEGKFFEFIDKNFLLIKDYLLLIEGEITPKIEEYLKGSGLCYVLANGCNIKKIDTSSRSNAKSSNNTQSMQKQVIVKEQIVYQESKKQKTKVIKKPVRSGEVIEWDGDIVIFSRVNSGAKVISEGNISVFETIDGIVEANGEFVIINSIGKGYVVFNGDILDKDSFSDGKNKKVIKTEDGYKIEEL